MFKAYLYYNNIYIENIIKLLKSIIAEILFKILKQKDII